MPDSTNKATDKAISTVLGTPWTFPFWPHLHSRLSKLIWSATMLCSRNEASGAPHVSMPESFAAAISMMQWEKAKMKRSWPTASVCSCCERTRDK